MPLLNKKPLELHRYNKRLKDDAEVFFCKCTNEIFENYEEYCQRVISCNSLIWTCAITGKTNLTYQEALSSEQNALKSIKDFPLELRTPILFLASKTKRKNFNDLVNDVFNFAKDRYFLGESVEVYINDNWVFGHILQVLLPSADEVNEYREKNNIYGSINNRPYPGCLYKYKVEQLENDEDSCASKIQVLPGDKVRRIKGVYTKEKNRIYLKQFAIFKKNKWRIQNNVLATYSIPGILFSNMFVGELPSFDGFSSENSKFSQQRTIDMYLNKKTEKNKVKSVESSRKTLLKKTDNVKRVSESVKVIHKKYQETINKVVEQTKRDLIKQKSLEDKAKKLEEIKKKRAQEKEEKAKLASFAKEWQRKREDLECEDLKNLPVPCPVNCRVPNELFGDVVMILEFFSSFRELLKVKDYFPFGLKLETVERALVDIEIAGPLPDIIQLLLSTLFNLQEQEDDEVQSTDYHRAGDLEIDESGDISTAEAIKSATFAASWSKMHHGVPLNKLSLDAITVSEILRLHLLASGGRAGDRNAKWRYQERGGYTNTDDPCLMLRLKDPHILRSLAIKSVVELSIGDKIKILSCLMNQILTYAEIRDIIEERYDKVKTSKNELKNDQVAESKKEKEITAQKLKEKKEARERGENLPDQSEELKLKELKESNKKKAEFHKRAMELRKVAMESQIVPLGQDRSYRKFWIFSTLGGLFIEDNEEWPGSCLSTPTPISKNFVLLEEDTMTYIKKLFEEERNWGSDKENEVNSSLPMGTQKKKLLSESNNVNSNSVYSTEEGENESNNEKLMSWVCTGNEETCNVHSKTNNRTQWLFYHKENEIEELINSLNKRGYREHRLRKALIENKDNIIPRLNHCPVHLLNRFALDSYVSSGPVKSTRSHKGYENANLKYPAGTPVQEILELYIRELILDTEEKIYCGGLGCLKVKNRNIWRNAIENRSYEKQDDNLSWRQYPIKKEKIMDKIKDDDGARPDTPCSLDCNSETEMLELKMDQNSVVNDLASAVLQIARSVEPRYLQKPLSNDEKKKEKMTAMERWEASLMSSTSFAQVYLHVATLENSIQWNKSALNARCKVCRRGGDGENMLLCDSCDRGFHLYCLKPKLSSVPLGDWFCSGCRPPEKVEKTKRSRRLFSEESDDDEDDQPLVSSKISRKIKSEDVSRKRKYKKSEESGDSGTQTLPYTLVYILKIQK
ncbi:bromodomain adjacent to zinc finger protein domain 1, baz1, putative [Pediculus humanus corporis]|uniref:Bromodomain adjacent to zinc finger domain protein 1A n=1 Tax=Pediculus humanus subsp. corporis TaxID=121224 RepID=E0VKS8_PEDHC|nr:bromodomain adjacent to zinc finger protein domain 1, baz1, putative [Pediculus humanus corporis]EEB13984.1 bromodomain adjacent to zinc finger protein domain 1, baz1, putative [Pediculus humanus corporis]